MDRLEFDEAKIDAFAVALLTALAEGPVGAALVALAAGQTRLVITRTGGPKHDVWALSLAATGDRAAEEIAAALGPL